MANRHSVSNSKPWQTVEKEITELLSRLNDSVFISLVNAFEGTNQRWFFSGQGRSGLIAQMATMRFMHLGHQTHFVSEVSAPSIQAGDSILVISGSGETSISVSYARIAKEVGAKVFLLTHKPDSSLAQIANVTLEIPVKETSQFGNTLFEQVILILLDSVVQTLTESISESHNKMWSRHTNLQ